MLYRIATKYHTVSMKKVPKKKNHWSLNVRSVIVFGKMHFVENIDECIKIAKNIWRKFGTDEKELKEEINRSSSRVLCLKFEIEHMTGKLVNES